MSIRWKRHLSGAAAVGVLAKALQITAADDWEDALSYPERKWSIFVKNRLSGKPGDPKRDIPHVVVLGSGWGAMSFVRHIDPAEMRVTVVSPRSFFFYTPLLAGIFFKLKTIDLPCRKSYFLVSVANECFW
jgi:hypothetical protein